MLNEWGIYHLNLGNVTENKGKNRDFVKRTFFLLFGHFTASDAYFIGILNHARQLPDTLEEHRLHRVTGDQLSEEQVRELRRKRINHVLTMQDGTVYRPPGNGTTVSGENVADIIETEWWLDRLRHLQQSIVGFIERERSHCSSILGSG